MTDPSYRDGRGAVHLYRPNGKRISTLFGNQAGDQIGFEGIVVLTNGNFVVISTEWNNGSAEKAGAVNWVDGARGLSGTVSTDNSLVGTSSGDNVGYAGVLALTNGNYVVSSILWSNGSVAHVGAAIDRLNRHGIRHSASAQDGCAGFSIAMTCRKSETKHFWTGTT